MWAQIFRKGIALKNFCRLGNVPQSRVRLRSAGQFDGGTHFKANRFSNLSDTALENLRHPLQHLYSLFNRSLTEGLKRGLRRSHCQINVGS